MGGGTKLSEEAHLTGNIRTIVANQVNVAIPRFFGLNCAPCKILKCAPSNWISLRVKCAPLKQWIWIKCAPSHTMRLICLVMHLVFSKILKYALQTFLRFIIHMIYTGFTHFCREISLVAITHFGSHFLAKFSGRRRKSILLDRDLGSPE